VHSSEDVMADAKKLVLVVDDEPDVRTFITAVLEDHGYRTVTAADGVQALERVAAEQPALITLDVSMPEKSGVRCYRDLRENDATKSIPIVLITGVSDEFQKFISTRKQVPPPDGYLSKPITADGLLATVRKLIG
jgi:CheY-like chemotaxis protein